MRLLQLFGNGKQVLMQFGRYAVIEHGSDGAVVRIRARRVPHGDC